MLAHLSIAPFNHPSSFSILAYNSIVIYIWYFATQHSASREYDELKHSSEFVLPYLVSSR